MPHSTKLIQIDEEKFGNYSVVPARDGENKWLDKLSKVNVFVGENNSGKSRFMRNLASSEYLTILPTSSASSAEVLKNSFQMAYRICTISTI